MTSVENRQNDLLDSIANQAPYSCLSPAQRDFLFDDCKLVKFEPGQVVLRNDYLPGRLYLIINGRIRFLTQSAENREPLTLDFRGGGQLVGWVSLLRGAPCEWVIASETTTALSISAEKFASVIIESSEFQSSFSRLTNPQESYLVTSCASRLSTKIDASYLANLVEYSKSSLVCHFLPGVPFEPPSETSNTHWYLSTESVPNYPVGSLVEKGAILPKVLGYKLPFRCIGIPVDFVPLTKSVVTAGASDIPFESDNTISSISQLGILENDLLEDNQKFPYIRGGTKIKNILAACQVVALQQKAPFRRDILQRLIENQFRRKSEVSLELIAKLCEVLGLKSQIAAVDTKNITSIECPVILLFEDTPVVLHAFSHNQAVIAHPIRGLVRIYLDEFKSSLGERFRFVLPRRIGSTPTSRFGWSWFTPLINKYKKSLVLVFIASLLSQLFGLAIPLLIQQIIDKVLSQGNISSLNVLGSVMVVLALFQGILMVLRTYVFVDTTDRMDLTLGSAVIDRLLSLPLPFFEKRQVGELSQRLGELNNIRSFLTGTALVSVLNIIFASLYLVVMIIYSPLLTAVALSTLPLYLLLIFGVAPIYKFLIRKRAVAQAKTQSHLIEVLGGIQTVKAQHFELTARWKWQDRYRDFVDNGFKSVALGSAAGEIGKFLNQVSSLLVLWVGMYLVLQGDLTLGMLIAFRIISGNVTGPLTQLSGLYQGFQKVQISMERVADIVDQNPELSRADELSQIPLPTINGNIRFENVRFRFGEKGPYQVDDVSVSIEQGQFVGVVGQSGSGKSTLMKLLPRLYDPDAGRIFIDDYDISKVNLSSLRRQIGIVPQDSLLFEGTIAENIALNDSEATTDSIIEAAKLACAHDFIMSLGQGYATPLAERGSNLSGGQRQRIAIARTILSNPQLLVMDEATSALDYNTERQLCLNLQKWAAGKTVLFITHRLSSIRSSDQILVMHDARLVETGTHEELIKLNQRYAALYSQQSD